MIAPSGATRFLIINPIARHDQIHLERLPDQIDLLEPDPRDQHE